MTHLCLNSRDFADQAGLMLTDMADAEDTILALGLCSAVHTKEMYLPQEVLDGAHLLTSCHTDKALTLACMHVCLQLAALSQ